MTVAFLQARSLDFIPKGHQDFKDTQVKLRLSSHNNLFFFNIYCTSVVI